MKHIFLITVYVVITSNLFAQADAEYKPVGGLLQLKNMHLWRGQEVTDEATLATNIYYINKKQNFKFGVWRGAGVNGNFKEIDYFLDYKMRGFTFALWDIYNFFPCAEYNKKQTFNYSVRETGHFVDISVSYQLHEKFLLKIYWATVILGRDRGGRMKRTGIPLLWS